MSSSSPPSKKRKNSTTTNTAKNDNIKSLLSTLFDPHGKRKSKKRKVDATNLIVHTPSTIPSSTVETAQLKPTTTDEKRGSRQYMKWEDRFNQAKQYYSPNGELIRDLPKDLYKWIAQQRCAYRKNKLRNDRLIQLQSFQNSLLLSNKDRVFKCYRSYQQQRMADSVVGRQQLSQAQESQYKEWQKKVWPNTGEETNTKALNGDHATTANNKNTSPTSSMDALLSASVTIDNNNKEEEDEGRSRSSHGWW